jgi:hypothetical protein
MDLRGRLEQVYINGVCGKGDAFAGFNGSNIRVHRGGSYVGQQCIIRHRIKKPAWQFISRGSNPHVTQGLAPNEYVLLGLWHKKHASHVLPRLDEINLYYDPGEMPIVLYFQEHNSKRRGRFEITRHKVTPISAGLKSGIRNSLPDPARASRVILAESPRDMDLLTEKIKELDLTPIHMDPFA